MKFSMITLFPHLIKGYAETSIIGRAAQKGLIQVETVNPREFTEDRHGKVDDSPYGGGSGMVLSCQPVYDAFLSLKPNLAPNAKILITTPAGRVFDHGLALELTAADQIVILCGHYEGFDHRIYQLIPELIGVSLGDFVLTGGELPALCMMDAVTRLIPGAVQKFTSVESDSFFTGLLDHPHYTRPAVYQGLEVPSVLLSGNHADIEQWRHREALRHTLLYRPDLLEKKALSPESLCMLAELQTGTMQMSSGSLADGLSGKS